jgi:hypothetical protein
MTGTCQRSSGEVCSRLQAAGRAAARLAARALESVDVSPGPISWQTGPCRHCTQWAAQWSRPESPVNLKQVVTSKAARHPVRALCLIPTRYSRAYATPNGTVPVEVATNAEISVTML